MFFFLVLTHQHILDKGLLNGLFCCYDSLGRHSFNIISIAPYDDDDKDDLLYWLQHDWHKVSNKTASEIILTAYFARKILHPLTTVWTWTLFRSFKTISDCVGHGCYLCIIRPPLCCPYPTGDSWMGHSQTKYLSAVGRKSKTHLVHCSVACYRFQTGAALTLSLHWSE